MVDANKARADLEGSKILPDEVKQEAILASASFDEARKQSVDWAKAVKEALRQLTKVSS